jgi:maltose O-acetyltransferase
MFQLTAEETSSLRSQFATLKTGRGRHRKYVPYVFTEHGAIMAASILNSPRAVEMSVYVVRAFVQLREMLASNKELARRFAQLETRLDKNARYRATQSSIRDRRRPACAGRQTALGVMRQSHGRTSYIVRSSMTVVSPQAADPGPLSLRQAADLPLRFVSVTINEGITAGVDPAQLTLGGQSKIRQLLREEFAGIHLRLLMARILLAPLPIHVGGRLRAMILRLIGFQIGRGTIMAGMPTITLDGNTYKKLVIGEGCWINIGCLFDLGAEIRIGNKVAIGHGVLVLTRSHEVGTSRQRAFTLITKPVNIGSGVWLGSRSTILPGVTIGAGAIVAAGSVVHQDVAPNTLVAGVPARAIKQLP